MSADNATVLVGFQPEPQAGRGTIGILWLCLPTIFLCLYTAIHPNVPGKALNLGDVLEGEGIGYANTLFRLLCFTIAPEVPLCISRNEFYMARRLRKAWNSIQPDMMISAQQAQFLLMRGWCFEDAEGTEDQQKTSFVVGEKFIDKITSPICKPEAHKEVIAFVYSTLPTDEEIGLMQTTDALGKIVTIAQILWFVTQVIGRLAEGQQISLIEVETTAYIFMAIMSYGFWWQKPYGIRKAVKQDIPAESLHLKSYFSTSDAPVDFRLEGFNFIYYFSFLTYAAPCIAAWKYRFPTPAEANLWRVSSLIMAVAMPVMGCAETLANSERFKGKFIGYFGERFIFFLPWVLFIIARIFVLVEACISLRAAPGGIYESIDWPSYWVHIGS